MASSTSCFLHHQALSSASVAASRQRRSAVLPARSSNLTVRAQKQVTGDDESLNDVSRRLMLTVFIGTAAATAKVSPAGAAYGEAAIAFMPSHHVIHASTTKMTQDRHGGDAPMSI